jgi:hypothetical protein
VFFLRLGDIFMTASLLNCTRKLKFLSANNHRASARKSNMKKKTITVAAFISIFVYFLYSCESTGNQTTADTATKQDTSLQRGAYLVSAIGCGGCHTPKIIGVSGRENDTSRLLSGYPSNRPVKVPSLKNMERGSAISDPTGTSETGLWGTTFAANITSDGTGIGNWSFPQFRNAIKHGKYMGINEERMIMPPMPWKDYRNLNDDDIKAIFNFLKTTKPVRNLVPEFIPGLQK